MDASHIHVDHAPRAHVHMSDLAISHLAFRQSNIRTRGVDQRVGIGLQEVVVGGLAGERDSIILRHGRESPSVQDGEDQRFRFGHLRFLLPECFLARVNGRVAKLFLDAE